MKWKRFVIFLMVLVVFFLINTAVIALPLYLPLYSNAMDKVSSKLTFDGNYEKQLAPLEGGGFMMIEPSGWRQMSYRYFDESLTEIEDFKGIPGVDRIGDVIFYDRDFGVSTTTSTLTFFEKGIPVSSELHRNLFPDRYKKMRIKDVILGGMYRGTDQFYIQLVYELTNSSVLFDLYSLVKIEGEIFENVLTVAYPSKVYPLTYLGSLFGDSLYVISPRSYFFTGDEENTDVYFYVINLKTSDMMSLKLEVPSGFTSLNDFLGMKFFFWRNRAYMLYYDEKDIATTVASVFDFERNGVIYQKTIENNRGSVNRLFFNPVSEGFGSVLYIPVFWQLPDNVNRYQTGLLFDDDAFTEFTDVIESRKDYGSYGYLLYYSVDDDGRIYYYTMYDVYAKVVIKHPNGFGTSLGTLGEDETRLTFSLIEMAILLSLTGLKYFGRKRKRPQENEGALELYPSSNEDQGGST